MARRVYDYSSNVGDLMHTALEMNRTHSLRIVRRKWLLAIHLREVHCVT